MNSIFICFIAGFNQNLGSLWGRAGSNHSSVSCHSPMQLFFAIIQVPPLVFLLSYPDHEARAHTECSAGHVDKYRCMLLLYWFGKWCLDQQGKCKVSSLIPPLYKLNPYLIRCVQWTINFCCHLLTQWLMNGKIRCHPARASCIPI